MTEVLFLLLPGALILDWAGPAEALRIANQVLQARGLPPRFRLRYAGPQDSMATSVGLPVSGVEPLPERLADGSWLVLVGMPGRTVDVANAPARAAIRWLAGLQPMLPRIRLVTVCAGALLAAHAGLLDGRRATTHHQHLDELRAAAPVLKWCPTACSCSMAASPPAPASPPASTWRCTWWRKAAGRRWRPKSLQTLDVIVASAAAWSMTRSSRLSWPIATTSTRCCTGCRT